MWEMHYITMLKINFVLYRFICILGGERIMGLVIVRKLIIAVLLSLALLKKESYRKIMKDTGSSKKGQREKEKITQRRRNERK